MLVAWTNPYRQRSTPCSRNWPRRGSSCHPARCGDATAFSPVGSLLVLIAGAFLGSLAVHLFQWDRRAEGRRASPALGLLALVPYVLGALLL